LIEAGPHGARSVCPGNLIARYVAEQLVAKGIMAAFVERIAEPWVTEALPDDTSFDDEVPF
jgi:hypothetical protein